MLRPDADVPAWLNALVRCPLEALGLLAVWDVQLGLAECLQDDPAVQASTRLQVEYWQARIRFRRDVQDDWATRIAACHEAIHIGNGLADQAVRNLISWLPAPHQDPATKLWRQADNGATEMQARGLATHLWGNLHV